MTDVSCQILSQLDVWHPILLMGPVDYSSLQYAPLLFQLTDLDVPRPSAPTNLHYFPLPFSYRMKRNLALRPILCVSVHNL